MNTTAPPQPTALTREQIEAIIATLQPVHRIMIRLLLLRYLDPTHDDIIFMAGERCEPDMRSGGNFSTTFGAKAASQPKVHGLPKAWCLAIETKVNQFRTQLREQRERLDLQATFLEDYLEGLRLELEAIEHLLTTDCETSQEDLDDLRSQAKLSPVTYALKKLADRADKLEVEEEDYLRERLSLEYQAHVRRLSRSKKRLDQVRLERQAAVMSSLSDEFLATIWGIARGPIMDRHVKAVQKYITALAAVMKASLDEGTWAAAVTAGLGPKLPGGSKNEGIGSKPVAYPGDLWSQTVQTLAAAPTAPSTPKPCGHHAGGKALVAKFRGMAAYVLGEDDETKVWALASQCLPCLNLLRAGQLEVHGVGHTIDSVLTRVKTHTAMPRKEVEETAAPKAPVAPEEHSEHVELILRNFIGDDAGQAGAKSWW